MGHPVYDAASTADALTRDRTFIVIPQREKFVIYIFMLKIFCNLQDYLLIINNDTLAASFCNSSFNSSFSWYTSIWFVEFIGTPT